MTGIIVNIEYKGTSTKSWENRIVREHQLVVSTNKSWQLKICYSVCLPCSGQERETTKIKESSFKSQHQHCCWLKPQTITLNTNNNNNNTTNLYCKIGNFRWSSIETDSLLEPHQLLPQRNYSFSHISVHFFYSS